MTPHECTICFGEQEEDKPLIRLPCGQHGVCPDGCLDSFFEQATKDEKYYPAACCSVALSADEYIEMQLIEFETYLEYKKKEAGEYSVHIRYRVYCGHSSCGEFISKDNYEIKDGVEYGKCDHCQTLTCVSCKAVLVEGPSFENCTNLAVLWHKNGLEYDGRAPCQNDKNKRCQPCNIIIAKAANTHICQVSDDDQKFKETAKEKGYQECHNCGKTIELMEACNHMSCGCGDEFCYICGKPWQGAHGCPLYGVPQYDEEGYNQDGFHKETGLNRDGSTRREANRQHHDEGDDEESDEEDELEDDPFWALIPAETRQILDNLPADVRLEAIEQERFRLAEAGLLPFDTHGQDEDGDEDGDEDEDEGEDEDEEENEKQEEVADSQEDEEAFQEEVDESDGEQDEDVDDTQSIAHAPALAIHNIQSPADGGVAVQAFAEAPQVTEPSEPATEREDIVSSVDSPVQPYDPFLDLAVDWPISGSDNQSAFSPTSDFPNGTYSPNPDTLPHAYESQGTPNSSPRGFGTGQSQHTFHWDYEQGCLVDSNTGSPISPPSGGGANNDDDEL